jgi:hypothetical protein
VCVHNIIQAVGGVQVGLEADIQFAAHGLVVHHDVQYALLAFDHLVAGLPRGRLDVGCEGIQIE